MPNSTNIKLNKNKKTVASLRVENNFSDSVNSVLDPLRENSNEAILDIGFSYQLL